MDYIELTVTIVPYENETAEILIALLGEEDFDGFLEQAESIIAYTNNLNEVALRVERAIARLKTSSSISYSYRSVERKNWNALWESNFPPVVVEDQLVIVAPFHQLETSYPYQILIEPKMSFGTGHHETTYMMLQHILKYDFLGKEVLDMGCGTGILSILAGKKGARKIVAIDTDEWAIENTIENCQRNYLTQIEVLRGDATIIPSRMFDIILANINRNVLLQDIPLYARYLYEGGWLFLSGFYVSDISDIQHVALISGLHLLDTCTKNQWASLVFEKQ